MIKPTFNINPGSNFTLLEQVMLGAPGAATVLSPAVPKGINRLFFLASVEHNDVASHVLQLLMTNPTGTQPYFIPLETHAAVAAGEFNCVIEPFLVPQGWVLSGQSLDAIGAGKILQLRGLYLDFLIV